MRSKVPAGARRAGWLIVVAAVALTGCTAAHPSHGGARPSNVTAATAFGAGAFTTKAFDADVRSLAAAGIGTYPDANSSAPLVAPSAPVSPLRLLRSQVAEIGRESGAGVGTGGAALDATLGRLAGRPVPMAAALTAYAASNRAVIHRIAPALTLPRTDPEHAVIPTVLIVAFVRDLAAVGGRAGHAPAEHSARLLAQLRADPATGLCEAAKGFLDRTIAAVFAGLHVDAVDTSGWSDAFKWFGGLLNGAIGIFDAILSGAQSVLVNGERLLLGPFVEVIAKLAAVATVVTDVLTFIRPLSYSWTFDPTTAPEFGIQGRPSLSWTDTLTVTTSGPTDWPDELKSCARVAGVALPELGLGGSRIDWRRPSPGGYLSVTSADPALVSQPDGSGTARVTFVTGEEPQDWHDRGTPHQAVVLLAGTVHRNTRLVNDAVSSALGALFSLVPAFLRGRVAAVVTALVQPLIADLTALSDLGVGVSVYVTYHGAPEPTPTPPSGSPTTPSCAPVGALRLPAGTYTGPFSSVDVMTDHFTGTLTLVVDGSGEITGTWTGRLDFDGKHVHVHTKESGTAGVVRVPADPTQQAAGFVNALRLTRSDGTPRETYLVSARGCGAVAGKLFSIVPGAATGSWQGTRS